jgi:hypothetical protein
MRWMLAGDWPVAGGARLLPAGTIVGDGGIPASELPSPMPINAMALDDEAAQMMRQWYPDQLFRLHFGPDVGMQTAAPQASSTRKRK